MCWSRISRESILSTGTYIRCTVHLDDRVVHPLLSLHLRGCAPRMSHDTAIFFSSARYTSHLAARWVRTEHGFAFPRKCQRKAKVSYVRKGFASFLFFKVRVFNHQAKASFGEFISLWDAGDQTEIGRPLAVCNANMVAGKFLTPS